MVLRLRHALLPILFLAPVVRVLGQCPDVKVVEPASIAYPGDKITFRVEVNAPSTWNLTYRWTVEGATIISGRSAPSVVVQAGKEARNVIAKISVDGMPAWCKSSASGTAAIAFIPEGDPFDTVGRLTPNVLRGVLDGFFSTLLANESDTAFIVLTITERERLDIANPRLQFIVKHAQFRKLDVSRIVFGLELGDEQETTLWRVPRGAELPPCDRCLILKPE